MENHYSIGYNKNRKRNKWNVTSLCMYKYYPSITTIQSIWTKEKRERERNNIYIFYGCNWVELNVS